MRKSLLQFTKVIPLILLLCFTSSWQKQVEGANALTEIYPDIWSKVNPDLYKQLKYRYIGAEGNRVIAVVGVAGDHKVYYAGAASGGIWKSIDGGSNWQPIFDDQTAQSIGSLAIAPSDRNIVWAGTGETFIRSNVSVGNGIYKSTDGGKTWAHMGLEKSRRIGRIVIDPRDPDIVFAAAMGHCYGPQQERGVFRTTNGGKTWERVLFVDENTGCSDIAMDPKNPRILFAGMWPLVIRTWGRHSGGPGGGLYVSRDGGTTWKRLRDNGLPEPPIGKVGVGVAASNSKRVYALIETGDGVLWRSDDGGHNWNLVNHDHNLTQRPHYYTRFAVATDDEDEVYTCATNQSMSLDGGETFKSQVLPGGDYHDMWIDPLLPDRMAVTHDHGLSITVNRGQSWERILLPVAQMYHVAVDNQIPYYVYGTIQDGLSFRGPSNSLQGGRRISSGEWHTVGGGEAGFAIPDPVDNNIVWAGTYDGYLDRFDLRTRHSRAVDVWPEGTVGAPAADGKYRFQFTFPIAISPHDHNKVYVGSQHVHQTTDGGHSWKVISPDLSTNDKSKQQDSGGLTVDNHQVDFCCVVFAIAESPLEEGLIWAGTNDGLVQVTRDGGANWTNVTRNIPNLPPWGTVSNVEPSRYDAGACYITVDFHQVNNRDPYVYKTADYGKSWKFISQDVPKSVFSYAHWIHEDPVRKGMLYLGTENALFVSFNDGANWLPLQNNLPHAPVHHMVIQEHFNDLVVGTYGRGFWILDDITPLQQLTPQVLNSQVYFFPLQPAYRFRNVASQMSPPTDLCAGQNKPYGVSINYYFKSTPAGDVILTILDEKGQMIRTLKGTKESGINRVWWDLKYEPPKETKLRTVPAKHPHTKFGPEGWRPLKTTHCWDWKTGHLAAPGTYTVKLTVDGQEFSQKLTVKKDPNSAGSEADIRAQLKLLLEIQDDINTVGDMIEQMEWIRKQIYDLTERLEGDSSAASVISAGKELDKKLIAVEENLFAMHALTGGTLDGFRATRKIYAKLGQLSERVRSTDHPPTIQEVEVHKVLKKRVATRQAQLNELLNKDMPAFNQMLKENNIPNIITKTP